jgi:hypothetical protein
MPSRRTLAIVGILMIVFGGLGTLLGSLGVLAGDGPPADAAPVWHAYATINTGFGIVGIVVNALQLAAGILVVRHHARARLVSLGYATLAIASTIAWLVMVIVWLAPSLKTGLGPAMGMGIVFSVLAGIVWPVAVFGVTRRIERRTGS